MTQRKWYWPLQIRVGKHVQRVDLSIPVLREALRCQVIAVAVKSQRQWALDNTCVIIIYVSTSMCCL